MKIVYHTLSECSGHHSRILSIGLFFCCIISQGQDLHNQSTLHINEVNIYVDGKISNSGLLINKGLIDVTGDWENQGSYMGNGSLHLSGNAAQYIFHNDQKIQSLTVKGIGTKYLKGKIDITRELYLMGGIFQVSGKDELSMKDGAIIFGGSAKSYVDGAITVQGNGYKFFPVGKNGIYTPIELMNVKGKDTRYSMEVFENAPLITVDNVVAKTGLYWQRKDLDGNFGGSVIAIGFDPTHFIDVSKINILVGTDWLKPFQAISDLEYSQESDKLTTRIDVVSPIIMLGEVKQNGNDGDFYFSTALSPQAADPVNRSVKVFGKRLQNKDFHFTVFNRWGAAVFESVSLENMSTSGWDGRSKNGDDLVSGPYPFILIAFDKAGKKFEKKGVISIIN